jgi:hypothetical protein
MLVGGTGWLILLAAAQVTVPFIGCESDGQSATAPIRGPMTVAIPATPAQSMAYYQSQLGRGVLAPHGWNCFESGRVLIVTPSRSRDLKDLTGPAVVRSILDRPSARNKRPIIARTPDGESILVGGDRPHVAEIAIRLPESLRWLAPSILRQFEVDAANANIYK